MRTISSSPPPGPMSRAARIFAVATAFVAAASSPSSPALSSSSSSPPSSPPPLPFSGVLRACASTAQRKPRCSATPSPPAASPALSRTGGWRGPAIGLHAEFLRRRRGGAIRVAARVQSLRGGLRRAGRERRGIQLRALQQGREGRRLVVQGPGAIHELGSRHNCVIVEPVGNFIRAPLALRGVLQPASRRLRT